MISEDPIDIVRPHHDISAHHDTSDSSADVIHILDDETERIPPGVVCISDDEPEFITIDEYIPDVMYISD